MNIEQLALAAIDKIVDVELFLVSNCAGMDKQGVLYCLDNIREAFNSANRIWQNVKDEQWKNAGHNCS